MSDVPTPHQLSDRIVRLEGELKVRRAENDAMESRIDATLAGMRSGIDATLAGMRTDIDATLAGMRVDMARRDADAAKRETDAVKREKQQLLAIAGLSALATTILGILIALPG